MKIMRLFWQFWTARGKAMSVPYACQPLCLLVMFTGILTTYLESLSSDLYAHLPLIWLNLALWSFLTMAEGMTGAWRKASSKFAIDAAMRRGLLGVLMGLAVQAIAMTLATHFILIIAIQCWLLYLLRVALHVDCNELATGCVSVDEAGAFVIAYGPKTGSYKGRDIHQFIVDKDGGLHPFVGVADLSQLDTQRMKGHIYLAGVLYGPALGESDSLA